MKKHLQIYITVIISFIIFSSLNIVATNTILTSEIIYVDDDNIDGPWLGTIDYPYQFIQDGINNSNNGDTIFVFQGIYFENIVINKSLNIVGENNSNTVIDGNYGYYVVNCLNNNIKIQNFTIRNSGGYIGNSGILISSEDIQILNCIIYRTKTGIYLKNVNNVMIESCIFHTNGEGLYFNFSNDIFVDNCLFTHNAIGINSYNSHNIDIKNCYVYTNGIGMYFESSYSIQVLNSAIYNNNDNQGGVFIDSCIDLNFINNNFVHNGFAFRILNSQIISIYQSSFLLNEHSAIMIENSKNVDVESCNFSEQFRFGMYVVSSSCRFTDNNFFDNLFGFYIEKSNCNVRKNWWGSLYGPALFERKDRDRIFAKLSIARYFPWLIFKNKFAGADWTITDDNYYINTSRFVEIDLPGVDSDNDLVPDWWEQIYGYDPLVWDDHKNIDEDCDGLNNIEECYTYEWGSDPNVKDIFLEIDWVESHNPDEISNKPSQDLIDSMVEVFSKHNIALHIDVGNFNGGEEIPYISNFSYATLRDLYWNYFLHNDLNNPRKGIFHYYLVADYGPWTGFSFFGWDQLDSFELSSEIINNNHPFIKKETIIIEVCMHELGHTLGLFVDDYGGIDNMIATKPYSIQFWKHLRYKSCMNYLHTYHILDYSDGSHGINDFDDWDNLDFYFFKNTNFNWPQS